MSDNPVPFASPGAPEFPIPIAEKFDYFNGLAVGLGPGDILITLSRNNVPFVTLNTSYVIAKTMGEALLKAVSGIEQITGHNVLGFSEMTKLLKQHGDDLQEHL